VYVAGHGAELFFNDGEKNAHINREGDDG